MTLEESAKKAGWEIYNIGTSEGLSEAAYYGLLDNHDIMVPSLYVYLWDGKVGSGRLITPQVIRGKTPEEDWHSSVEIQKELDLFLKKPILALDFDGVLHKYTTSWERADVIPDDPVDGAYEFLVDAREHFRLIVHSSRARYRGGLEAMQDWMMKHGLPEVEFATEKPGAFLTLDDRAFQFNGIWPDPKKLLDFKPWNRRSE